MAVFDNLNYSYSNGVAPSVIQYHERNLIRDFESKLVHGRDLQKRTLPLNNGKTVTFRKMVPFAPITEPLQEGVTPPGMPVSMTNFTAVVKPYGRHVELTDELNWSTLDNMHREVSTLLDRQAVESVDGIIRDVLHAGLNVQYAGGKTARTGLTATDTLTYAEVKKAVRTLKKANAKPFADGCFHAIVGPDTVYDLTNDPMWIDVAKYQDKSKIESGELGKMAGVKFFETTESKIFTAEEYLFGTTATITLTGYDAATRTLTCAATGFGADDAARVQNARILIGKSVVLTAGGDPYNAAVENVTFDGTNAKICLRWAPTGYAHASGATLTPAGGGATGVEVHSTLIYGQDFGGMIELGGNGGNVSIIVKPAGSAGAADPINQRSTIAWKVKGFCAVILQEAYGIRIEHGVTG